MNYRVHQIDLGTDGQPENNASHLFTTYGEQRHTMCKKCWYCRWY